MEHRLEIRTLIFKNQRLFENGALILKLNFDFEIESFFYIELEPSH